jgi:hypothetical protein
MLTTFLITMSMVALCVAIHYEVLYRLGGFVESLMVSPRQEVITGVILALTAHVIEIYIFAGGYYYALEFSNIGGFTGTSKMEDFFDCVYLSFVTYTTLGFGDIVPHGWVRFMVGTEAMMGLVQIAWTASYLYMQMEHHWGHAATSKGASTGGGSQSGSSPE